MPLSASGHRASTSTMPQLRLSSLVLGIVGLVLCATATAAAPAPSGPDSPSPAAAAAAAASPALEPSGTIDDILYDQRQNGTENFRIHMNDVTVVVAPSDGLLQLLSAGGSTDLLNFGAGQNTNSHQLPTSEFTTNIAGAGDGKPGFDCDALGKCRHAQQSTPNKKNRFRLSNILMPLFNRVQHNNNN